MIHTTTDIVDARNRLSGWREVVCQTVYDLPGCSPSDRSFACTASGRASSPIIAAPAPKDCCLVNLQLSGRSRIAQDGACLTLAPSEIAILDGRRPFHLEFAEPISRVIAFLPRDMIARRASWLWQRPACKVMTSDCRYADLARQHMLHLAAEKQDLNESAASVLLDNLFNLFALANIHAAGSDGPKRELPLESLLAYCRQNLHEATLSPSFVATYFGISVRTLHLRFEQFGQSFSRWLLDARLEACGAALRDPNSAGHTISEVAYRCGFNDLSHFNRTFRARFDMTPRQWRAQPQHAHASEQRFARPPRSSHVGGVERLVLS